MSRIKIWGSYGHMSMSRFKHRWSEVKGQALWVSGQRPRIVARVLYIRGHGLMVRGQASRFEGCVFRVTDHGLRFIGSEIRGRWSDVKDQGSKAGGQMSRINVWRSCGHMSRVKVPGSVIRNQWSRFMCWWSEVKDIGSNVMGQRSSARIRGQGSRYRVNGQKSDIKVQGSWVQGSSVIESQGTRYQGLVIRCQRSRFKCQWSDAKDLGLRVMWSCVRCQSSSVSDQKSRVKVYGSVVRGQG